LEGILERDGGKRAAALDPELNATRKIALYVKWRSVDRFNPKAVGAPVVGGLVKPHQPDECFLDGMTKLRKPNGLQ
jgi:hypothetical protein